MEVRREQADRRLAPSPPTPRKEKRGNSRVQEERAVAQLVSQDKAALAPLNRPWRVRGWYGVQINRRGTVSTVPIQNGTYSR